MSNREDVLNYNKNIINFKKFGTFPENVNVLNNFMQVPFHLCKLGDKYKISIEMIKLLTEQSHAFKICH